MFGATRLQYLGYTLTEDGVTVSDEKTKAIKEVEEPDTELKIRAFIGLANYFRFLIPNFARLTGPLTQLTTKTTEWKGGPLPKVAKECFQTLKDRLSEYPVVAYPRKELPFVLRTDGALGDKTRPGGLGAVLLQAHEDGKERVVAYASRALKQHERNYSAFLIEQAAAVYGIEHFDVYLRGRLFTLLTDHRPMETMSATHKRTLNRLQQLMLEYDFTLAYKPGEDNKVADFLSRNAPMAAITVTVAPTAAEVQKAQKLDADLDLIVKFLTQKELPKDPKKMSWVMRCSEQCWVDKDNVLWFRSARRGFRMKDLLVAPKRLQPILVEAAHVTREAGHGGEARTCERIMSSFWWPGITNDVKKFVASCKTCQLSRTPMPPPGTLRPLEIADAPNMRVHAELFGPLKTSGDGNKYILVITDSFTKYAELVAITNKEAETVAKAFFERWICRFSVPAVLVTDQGKEFCNKVLEEVCKLWGIKKIRTSAFHPQTNTAAERYNQTIIKFMRAVLENNTTLDWEAQLPCLMMAYNMHVHKATKETPFFLTFIADPKLPFFDLSQQRQRFSGSYASDAFLESQDAFRRAKDNMKEAQEIREKYYARKSKERKFEPGERVLVHFPNTPQGINPKFYKKWQLMKIVRQVGPLNVIVKGEGKKESLVHVDRVQHAKVSDIEEETDSALRPYTEGQHFVFPRSEQVRITRSIPQEEREQDQQEYFFWGPSAGGAEVSRSERGQETRQGQQHEQTPGDGATPQRRGGAAGRFRKEAERDSRRDEDSSSSNSGDGETGDDDGLEDEEGDESLGQEGGGVEESPTGHSSRRGDGAEGSQAQTPRAGGSGSWALPDPWSVLGRALFPAPDSPADEVYDGNEGGRRRGRGRDQAQGDGLEQATGVGSRVTRARARQEGITVEDIPLPKSSKQRRRK